MKLVGLCPNLGLNVVVVQEHAVVVVAVSDYDPHVVVPRMSLLWGYWGQGTTGQS